MEFYHPIMSMIYGHRVRLRRRRRRIIRRRRRRRKRILPYWINYAVHETKLELIFVCVFVMVHWSVYLAQIMMGWGSNLRQWIFLNLGSAYTYFFFNTPPMSKMHARDKTKRTKYRQWSHYFVLQLLFKPNKVQTTVTLDER